jgi:DNA-binding NarL/FixJ family response regulator
VSTFPTTVVVVDDQELVRDGIAALLSAEPDLEVVGTAADGVEAIGLVQSLHPVVVLMDIQMPDIDGIEATRRLCASGTDAKILILTTFGADDNVIAALRAGASGFLLKDSPRHALVAAVRAVAAGDAAVDAQVLRRLVHHHVHDGRPEEGVELGRLSPREAEIFRLVGRGATNDEIARQLFISETTVKTHIARTQAKLGARDRIHLVVMANHTPLAGDG